MFSLTDSLHYYLYNGVTDMRNSFDGLCGLVRNELHREPLSGDVFLFVNKRRNLIKLLHWETGGFVLYYKRLEAGTIELPDMEKNVKSYPLNWATLVMIIEGLSIKRIGRRKRFAGARSC